MSQDEAIAMFLDVAETYRNYLPKLKTLIDDYGYGENELPGDDPETYADLYEREVAHFETMYNAEHLNALQSSDHTQKYFEDVYHGFFNDFEEVSGFATHVDHVLEQLN